MPTLRDVTTRTEQVRAAVAESGVRDGASCLYAHGATGGGSGRGESGRLGAHLPRRPVAAGFSTKKAPRPKPRRLLSGKPATGNQEIRSQR